MILIAESGSTKTNWLTEKGEVHSTIGFNPLFFSSAEIYDELMRHEDLKKAQNTFSKVYFYGASCSTDSRKEIVRVALQKFFAGAKIIEVDHDMKAAALTAYDGRPGITCILGTGSNSCLYDGKDIQETVPALAFILGDEGSGAYFGKKLTALFLYNELPPATMNILREQYGLEKEQILESVYQKPRPNVYLAQFAKVLTDSPDRDYMNQMVEEGFTDFFKHHVACYENYTRYPVHFIGSVAWFHQAVLKKVAGRFNCELGNIIRNPVQKLLEWHLRQDALTSR